jgi:hypothetical protein
MLVGSRADPLPAGTEAQLAAFTELAGTAISNGEAQAALTASRARIVAAADASRRRIERSLHDGAQQRLVSLALDLRAARATALGRQARPAAGRSSRRAGRRAGGPARDRPRPTPGHPGRRRPRVRRERSVLVSPWTRRLVLVDANLRLSGISSTSASRCRSSSRRPSGGSTAERQWRSRRRSDGVASG